MYENELKKMSKSAVCREEVIVESLPMKKRDRPPLLGENNDICLRKLLVSMRSRGAPVETSIIISVGHGIMLKCDRSSLEEFRGTVQLNKKWAKSVLRRMGITKRRANSKAKILPGNFIEIKEQYLMGIKSVVTMEELLCELNWDQTAMKIVPSLQWTLEIVATDDKHQITAVLTCSLAGSFLPIQLIYKGTTPRCLFKNVSFPEDRHLTYIAIIS